MKTHKRPFALLLALTLLFATVPAAAYTSGSLLPQVRSYTQPFADTHGTWCDSYAQTVYEVGLMDGKSTDRFDPKGTLTCAQIIVVTARLHELLNGQDGKFASPADGEEWYQPYLDYLETLYRTDAETYADLAEALGYVEDAPYSACDRYDFVWLLSSVLPDSALKPINSIQVLPDDSDEDVLAFYNAGILTGFDDYGTFHGLQPLNRGQAAAMLARIVDPSQRMHFTPKAFSFCESLLGLPADTVMLTIDGYEVSGDLFTLVAARTAAAIQAEATAACLEKYADYIGEYMQKVLSSNYQSPAEYRFQDFLLQEHGIDMEAESAVRWDEPDEAGLTPARKASAHTLKLLKDFAMLFTHANKYPLTAQQQTELRNQLPEYLRESYGFSQAFAEEMLTAQFLLKNLTGKKVPSAQELNNFLADNGLFYGRCIQIAYDREDFSWYGRDHVHAMKLAQHALQLAQLHLGDDEYFHTLCQGFSEIKDSDPDLINVDDLTPSQQNELRSLAVGGLSNVLTIEQADAEIGYCIFFLKDNPSQSEEVLSSAGAAFADAQLNQWSETAVVVTTPLYDSLRMADLAAACKNLGELPMFTLG